MVFSLFYWNINSGKKFILLKLGTENELAKLQMRTGNLSIEFKSKRKLNNIFQIELNFIFIFIV